MSAITLNAEAASALAAITTKSELRAPDGRSLGLFIPPQLAEEVESILAERSLYAEPTPEELKAAEAAGGAIPHDEVVKRLGLG